MVSFAMRRQHDSRWTLSSRNTFATLCLLALCIASAFASSSRPNPLKRISYATDSWIEVVPRRIPATSDSSQSHWAEQSAQLANSSSSHRRSLGSPVRSSDSIRLSVRGFDQTFFLHLDPNDNIVPPGGAKRKVWRWDEEKGEDVLVREETINRNDVRAYHGVVVHESITTQRMHEDELGVSRTRMGVDDVGVMGPAAILLHDDGLVSGTPRFEGTFEWNGNTHTIQSARVFNRARQALDPRPHKRSIDGNHMIIHRESDIMIEDEMVAYGLKSRSEVRATTGCSFDAHDYNANNPLILSQGNNLNTSRSPMDFFVKQGSSSLPDLLRRGMAWWDVSGSAADEWFDRRDLDMDPDFASRSEFSYEAEHAKLLMAKRQDGRGSSGNTSFVSSIGDTSGCPNSAMVVYVGMAADCTFTQDYNGDTGETSSALLQIMNSVSIVYRNTFNVSLGVVELDVRESTCSGSNTTAANWNRACDDLTIDGRLNAFSVWRGSQEGNGIGVWNLLTSCTSGAEVGVAWLGTLCMASSFSSGGDTVSGTQVSASSSRTAQVVAHEIGHVFGAVHDCTTGCSISGNMATQSGAGTCCPRSSTSCNDNAGHIMSPVAEQSTSTFSACSIGNVCNMLTAGLNTTCIEPQGQRETLSTEQCGNGILEPGEECDAGPNGSGCCSTECRLVNGAVCDPSSSVCCQDTCQFAPDTTVCRPAKDGSECDNVEYCTGDSVTCPEDTYLDNGEDCGDGLSCANGICTSRDLQCQQQTGATTSFTRSCSAGGDNACSLSCRDPTSSNRCTIFQSNFVDGTSCGSGGYCQGGQCEYSSGSGFERWYRNNLRISIPVTIVIGIIVLLILAGLIRKCCCGGGSRRRKQRKGAASGGYVAGVPAPPPSRRGPFAPPPMGPPPSSSSYRPPPPPVPPRSHQPNGRYSSGAPPYESYQSGGGGGWVDPAAWNGPNHGSQR